MNKPNIIIILADDMGYGDFSCFNFGASQTPHLDSLISEGTCATQHYSASPICAPARAAILTGRYPHRTGVIDTISVSKLSYLSTRETTIGDIFKGSGYKTGYIGKWHSGGLGDAYHPNFRGFDEFVGFRAGGSSYFNWDLEYNGVTKNTDGRYLTDVLTEEAVSYIQRQKNEPFLLHVAYNAPHGPFEALEEDLKTFSDKGSFTDHVSTIYAMIKRMDLGIGRILETLKKLNVDKNTIVMFSSDNGPQMKCDNHTKRFNCGFKGSKGSIYEGGIRVPLIIRWPDGLQGGEHFHDLIHSTDWLPTLATIAGIDLVNKKELDGQNILPALRNEGEAKLKQKRFWQWSRGVPVNTHNAAMRDGDWKYVLPGDIIANDIFKSEGWKVDLSVTSDMLNNPTAYLDSIPDAVGHPPCVGASKEIPELYNLRSNPLEDDNLIDKHPDIARRMQLELDNWFEDVEKDRSTILDKPFRSADMFL